MKSKHKCWDCRNAIADGRCEYILSGKAVKDWQAEWNTEYNSYTVLNCPKFIKDKAEEKTNDVGESAFYKKKRRLMRKQRELDKRRIDGSKIMD